MPWTVLRTVTPMLTAAVLTFSATTSVHAQLPYGCPGGYYYDTHFGRCVPISYSVEPSEGTESIAPSNGSRQQPSRQYGTSGPANSKLGGSNGGETSGTTR